MESSEKYGNNHKTVINRQYIHGNTFHHRSNKGCANAKHIILLFFAQKFANNYVKKHMVKWAH